MRRHAEELLDSWLNPSNRKPLVIRGARQVGKSTLVRQFARNHGLDLSEINLEKQLYLEPIFKSLDMPRILRELEGLVGKKIGTENGLLFLDEIQATPSVLPALRYFYEEFPSLPVIAAGSLLEFSLKDHTFSMPVGRIEYLHLGPMTFSEFLSALKDDHLLEQMNLYKPEDLWPDSLHKKLLHRQREYMLTGGMPEAVLEFVTTNSLTEAQRIHRAILSTFIDDFPKYGHPKKDIFRLQNAFRYIPAHVGEKVKFSAISKDDRSADTKQALSLLTMAKLITPIAYSPASGIPLGADSNPAIFKCLFLDIGLMNTSCGLDWTAINSLSERSLVNEGGLAEQFIGQHLLYRDGGITVPELHYWVREGQAENAEVDFIVSEGNWILPIEVKAGKAGTLRSLQQFIYQKEPPVAVRFDLNPPSLADYDHVIRVGNNIHPITYRMLSLPLYMVGELRRIIAILRSSHLLKPYNPQSHAIF